MQQGSIIIGNHGYFYRDGDGITVPAAATSDRTHKAGAADPLWNDFGIISSLELDPKQEEKQIFAPTPGRLRLYDSIPTKNQLDIGIDLEEMSPLVWELIFGTAPLDDESTQYNPLSAPVKKGWLKIQQYRGDNDQPFNTVDLYVRLMVKSAVKIADDVVKTSLTANVLHSTLNTGVLS